MLRVAAAMAIVAIGATAVHAQSAALRQRLEAMKATAEATKAPGAMMMRTAPFDLAKVQAALKVFQDEALKLKSLWPENSRTSDTRALPSVWAKKADFLGRFDKLAAEAKAAESTIKDEATFKAQWNKLISANCVACHKDYQRPAH